VLCRVLLAVGLALVLLATAAGLLAVAVRLAWQQVPPPPAAITFASRVVLAANQTSALRLPPQPADLQHGIRLA
jgi:hypothetical protein